MNDTVKIVNQKQATLYIKNGLKPLDIYCSNTEDILVYVFDKKKSKPLFDLWCKHELK